MDFILLRKSGFEPQTSQWCSVNHYYSERPMSMHYSHLNANVSLTLYLAKRQRFFSHSVKYTQNLAVENLEINSYWTNVAERNK